MTNTSTAVAAVILIGVLVAVVVAGAAQFFIPSEATVDFPFTITIDSQDYDNNTALEWGNMTWGGSYNKNLTITNIASANYTTYLVTDEPEGMVMGWNGNNTLLIPTQNVTGLLWLNVTGTPTPQTYNWTVIVNGIG